MDEPNTSVMVGMPAAESRVRPLKVAPPGHEDLGLAGQVGAARLGQVDQRAAGWSPAISWARRPLATVVGLEVPPRTVGSLALITHCDALDQPDAGDQAAAERIGGAPAGQRRQLQERRVGIDQQVDALAHEQAAPLAVAGHVPLAAALEHLGLRRPAPRRAALEHGRIGRDS